MSKKNVVMDGNTAAAYASYAFTEVAGIFPITPSSTMAEKVDQWAAGGKKNIFGKPVRIIEMQSEGGAAGLCHGSLQAGALTTTYTASQGLLLMIPDMYKIAGEFLPSVFHVSARTLSVHGLSIFGDHSDVMGCRMIGFAMLASSSPQEAMDLGAVAHLASIRARHPFIHFFDGFRTSHEMQKIEALDYDDLEKLVDYEKINEFRKNSLNPEQAVTRGTTINPDIFFQCREGCNEQFQTIPDIVQEYMDEINQLTGRDYQLFNYYGAEDAEEVVISMCSNCETTMEAVDYLNAKGRKVGAIQVHLYRPFSAEHFLKAIPETCKKIAVLDRTKEPGCLGEPLFQDVETVINRSSRSDIIVVGGRYGLSSKDTTPGQIVAVYDNLLNDEPKNNFTIGIKDDVTFTSLDYQEVDVTSENETSCKLWAIGGDGTVGASKNTVTIIGANTDMHAQAYFSYDSKKTGGLTQSHLRFGNREIRSPYLINTADFVAVHEPSYLGRYDVTKDLKPGGTFLLNCAWPADQLEDHLPGKMKAELAAKKANFYIIDATKIAGEIGLGNRTNTVLQAAFFALTDIIPIELAIEEMKKGIYKSYYAKAGQKVVDLNYEAVERGITGMEKVEIPASWANADDDAGAQPDVPDFIKDIVIPMNCERGNELPVSIFKKHNCLDGTWMSGTTQYEKREVATKVPEWTSEHCIQCNRCSFVCPHAAIRPILTDADEEAVKPAAFETVSAKGMEGYRYRLQVSPSDCLGCGSCVKTCPAKIPALKMVPAASQVQEKENWEFAVNTVKIKKHAVSDASIKSSQFAKPYFEFSPACAGCAETPYIKLVSQLFGDRMYVANASGCSTAYGGGVPATPYTTDERGYGPAWQMSLFEDNAEFGFGFRIAQDAINAELKLHIQNLVDKGIAANACGEYLEHCDDSSRTREVSEQLVEAVKLVETDDAEIRESIAFIIDNKIYLTKKSVWCFGGDGWAYDIGYGGLDHVLSQNEDVNVLVLDTEVYSNTGGQASKATPAAAVAKFASGGKEVKKKDLGLMAMSYGYVYVAQIAMGADQAQTLKAIREAEAYPGPSIVIAYCPCVEHGIKGGMGCSQIEQKLAVDCGYWHLYRYDPRLKKEGKNPFILDSKEPTGDLLEYLKSERRYASLEYAFPEKADRLYDKAIKDSAERLETYKRLFNSGC